MFSENGNGMRFSASVDYNYANDWMMFALWYSMQKYLPDAELIINCKPPKKMEQQLFSWCRRCNVKFNFNQSSDGIIINFSDIIMIREIEEGTEIKDIKLFCSNCCDEFFTPFVTYGKGFGNFVTANWINTMDCPFDKADKFMTASINTNEAIILKLWRQLSPIYTTLSRG